jgi:hypothetical protein
MKKLDKLEISGIIFCVTCLLPMLLAFLADLMNKGSNL